jgi:two-component system, OmpR family, response regulator
VKILIVEDNEKVADSLAVALRSQGYVCEICNDGEDGWFKGSTETYTAIILDLGLPTLDGLSILKRWRGEGIKTPILILSARGTWTERVEGIDAGADDYLPKPFEMAELLSRLRAITRRSSSVATTAVTLGPLIIDSKTGHVMLSGVKLNVTPLEFRLLHYLASNLDRVVPQSELAEALYEHDHDRDNNAIEATVSRVRKKLGGTILHNKRGFGYYLATE